jgi:hypothetical protein
MRSILARDEADGVRRHSTLNVANHVVHPTDGDDARLVGRQARTASGSIKAAPARPRFPRRTVGAPRLIRPRSCFGEIPRAEAASIRGSGATVIFMFCCSCGMNA